MLQNSRHSRESGNPDNQMRPAQRDNILLLSAARASFFNWIPAFAGMTAEELI
jgi:hypothetical protein